MSSRRQCRWADFQRVIVYYKLQLERCYDHIIVNAYTFIEEKMSKLYYESVLLKQTLQWLNYNKE